MCGFPCWKNSDNPVLQSKQSLWHQYSVFSWSGSHIRWGQAFRLRHLSTGHYLALTEDRGLVLQNTEKSDTAATAFCFRPSKVSAHYPYISIIHLFYFYNLLWFAPWARQLNYQSCPGCWCQSMFLVNLPHYKKTQNIFPWLLHQRLLRCVCKLLMSSWLAAINWPFHSCWLDSTVNVGANIHVVHWQLAGM